MTTKQLNGLTLGCLAACVFLSACATSKGPVAYDYPMPDSFEVHDYDYVVVKVEAEAGLYLYEHGLDRLRERIVETIVRDAPHLQVPPPAESLPARTLVVTVRMSEYDQGNRLKRAMLAGLGRVRIAGQVRVVDAGTDHVVGEYLVEKQFAWGGVYGGMTTIEEVEVGFAEGVADGITGRGRVF